MSSGGPTLGPQRFDPPTPQEWSALAKRGGDPLLLVREGRAILDASPIFVSVDGKMQCLDTDENIAQRVAARIALADSLEQYAGIAGADSIVSIFGRQHPNARDANTTVLDPGMLRVAAVLFEDHETASRLATFTKLSVDDQLRQLLQLGVQIGALKPSSSPESSSSARTRMTTSPEDIEKLKDAFPALLLAQLRFMRPFIQETREMWRAGLRTANATAIGPLLAELKPYADTIYGPPTKGRDFEGLASDLAAMRMPEEFIRDSQIKTANICEGITGDRFLMNSFEDLACYVIVRLWSADMRADYLRRGELNLSDGKPMGIRDEQNAKDVLHSVVIRVNEIACREYDIPPVPLRFQLGPGTASEGTAGAYSLETRDICLNFDQVLTELRGGAPGVIGTLVHEITHAYQHALALGKTQHRVPPGFRDAGAVFDFNAANYAPAGATSVYLYRRQPMERHAHYVGYTVQRNIELALVARKAKWGLDNQLSEEKSRIVNAWTLSSTEPNPINPPKSESDAMSRGTIFPRQPDTIPPWQRPAQEIDKPPSTDQPPSGEVTDSDEKD